MIQFSYVYIFFFRFFSVTSYYKMLSVVPMLHSGSSPFSILLHSSVCLLVPTSEFTLLPPFPLWLS